MGSIGWLRPMVPDEPHLPTASALQQYAAHAIIRVTAKWLHMLVPSGGVHKPYAAQVRTAEHYNANRTSYNALHAHSRTMSKGMHYNIKGPNKQRRRLRASRRISMYGSNTVPVLPDGQRAHLTHHGPIGATLL